MSQPEASEELISMLGSKEEAKKFAKYLFHTLPQRDALQFGKRVNYFKGEKLVAALTRKEEDGERKSHKFFHDLTPHECGLVGTALVKHGFIHASKIKNREKRELQPVPVKLPASGKLVNSFDPDLFYTWLYTSSSMKGYFMLGFVLFAFTSAVMFPIWPDILKTGVWYLSVTFLLLLIGIIILRLIIYTWLWLFGFEVWLFPNLFDDDASIVESFIPVITFEKGSTSNESWILRAVSAVCILYSIVQIAMQPTDWDEVIKAQKEFVHDLYEGKMISDEEYQWYDVNGKDNSVLSRKIPKLEDLQKEIDEEETELEEQSPEPHESKEQKEL
eukprot:maker-scaffold_68-snap-gene-0.92-mRNA-1 protein AED:0.00 eAED:0.00 QI:163/1/1/1/1/1/2/1106/330